MAPDEVWFEVEEQIQAPPDEVFAYLVDPERYVQWMGAEARLEPRPGGTYWVRMPHDVIAVGEFVTVEPPRRVVFTWGWDGDHRVPAGSTTVEITLHELEGATLVRLRHSGLPDEGAGDAHTEGWHKYLGRLAVLAAGGDPGPDLGRELGGSGP
jgi:uncharacterized protein YndB with AHSA1/START domain